MSEGTTSVIFSAMPEGLHQGLANPVVLWKLKVNKSGLVGAFWLCPSSPFLTLAPFPSHEHLRWTYSFSSIHLLTLFPANSGSTSSRNRSLCLYALSDPSLAPL